MYPRIHFHWQRISIYKRGYWGGYFSVYFLWIARYGVTFVKITEALITGIWNAFCKSIDHLYDVCH